MLAPSLWLCLLYMSLISERNRGGGSGCDGGGGGDGGSGGSDSAKAAKTLAILPEEKHQLNAVHFL